MNDLVVVGLAGFAASFVDGALGMGFGPTSSSILLSSGVAPAGVSATVNLAKIVTGAAAAVSHWRFGNVDRSIVVRLALPGTAGALVGAAIVTTVDGDRLRPLLALMLLVIGLRILWRFSLPVPAGHVDHATVQRVEVAGAAGGVTNGLIGAWGPIVTPFLLHRGVRPRHVVGSVNTAEVAVAVVAAGTILTSGGSGIDAGTLAAMLAGGVVASPIAAWTVRFVPARLLGVLVAGLLLATNARQLTAWAGLATSPWAAYVAIAVLVAGAAWRPQLSAAASAGPRLLDRRRAL
jgi:uncharacterized membrane protein YfcA